MRKASLLCKFHIGSVTYFKRENSAYFHSENDSSIMLHELKHTSE